MRSAPTWEDSSDRLIDDLSASGVNQTVQTADFIAAMLLEVLKCNEGSPLMGRSFDLKSAYKQLAIATQSLPFAFVAFITLRRQGQNCFSFLRHRLEQREASSLFSGCQMQYGT